MKLMLAAATAALACVALAEGPAGGPGRGPMVPMGNGGPGFQLGEPIVRIVANPKTAAEVGLTKEQIESVQAIMKEQRKLDKDLRERTKKAMEKEVELFKAEKPDEAAVMAAIDELFEVRKEMAKGQARKVIRIKSLLSSEQIEKALEKVEQMRNERRERRGMGPRSISGKRNPPPAPDANPPPAPAE